MTTKQLYKIRSEVFKMCLDSMPEDERTSFNIVGVALLWEISNGTHTARVWTNHESQMNTNLLELLGFTEEAEVKLLIKLNKQTKCADIFSLR